MLHRCWNYKKDIQDFSSRLLWSFLMSTYITLQHLLRWKKIHSSIEFSFSRIKKIQGVEITKHLVELNEEIYASFILLSFQISRYPGWTWKNFHDGSSSACFGEVLVWDDAPRAYRWSSRFGYWEDSFEAAREGCRSVLECLGIKASTRVLVIFWSTVTAAGLLWEHDQTRFDEAKHEELRMAVVGGEVKRPIIYCFACFGTRRLRQDWAANFRCFATGCHGVAAGDRWRYRNEYPFYWNDGASFWSTQCAWFVNRKLAMSNIDWEFLTQWDGRSERQMKKKSSNTNKWIDVKRHVFFMEC